MVNEEILTWRRQNQRRPRTTAEYAEYAEKKGLAHSAYSAVQELKPVCVQFKKDEAKGDTETRRA